MNKAIQDRKDEISKDLVEKRIEHDNLKDNDFNGTNSKQIEDLEEEMLKLQDEFQKLNKL